MPHNLGASDPAVLRAGALAAVDEAAGAARAAYITTIAGQDATYTDKLADCQAYLAADSPDIADYPWVAAEAQAQDSSPAEAAAAVVAAYQTWRQVGIACEKTRISGKRQIRAAVDAPAICAARNQAVSALNKIRDAAPADETA